MSRTEYTFSLGLKFIADDNSVIRYGGGASIDWTAFPSGVIPAGTAVELSATGIVPAAGVNTAYLVAADCVKAGAILPGSSDATGLIAGGQIREAALPAPLTTEVKAALGVRFGYQ